MSNKYYDFFESIQKQFDLIADQLDLDQVTRDLLRMPVREIQFAIPVRMDNGDAKIFRGARVQHNDARGTGKGGVRFHPMEDIGIIRALAMLKTWQCAVVDLPLGGSMGGIACDPHDLSPSEQERLCRGWIRQVSKNVGPNWDVPGTDLMTNAQHMLWMLDEYETINGVKSPGFISGKPVHFGGSRGIKEASGFGLVITIREMFKDLGWKPANTSASFQGFGNVARYAIEYYQKIGGKVVSVACLESNERTPYTFVKKDGILLDELLSAANAFGDVNRQKAEQLGYECLPGEDWLKQEVDILVPAAMELQITRENLDTIHPRVKIIVEGANGPVAQEADGLLKQKGIYVIPDLLANAGGFICSYFEQVQGNMNYYWRREEVLGKLDVQLTDAYLSIRDHAKLYNVSMREAAYRIAVDRVVRACQERGWI